MVKLTNAIGAEKILPVTMSFKRVPLDIDIPSQPLFGLDGDVVIGKATLRPRQFALEGVIYYPDREQISREFDSLLHFLAKAPITVYRQQQDNRFLRARPLGAPQDWIDKGAELGLQVPMIAHDPYWYGIKQVDNRAVTSSGQAWSLEVDGTTETPPILKISFASNCSHPVISNGLYSIELLGDFSPGDTVEVFNDTYTITKNGVNALHLACNEWLLRGFMLHPDTNEIKFTAAGTVSVVVEITWRPRWL